MTYLSSGGMVTLDGRVPENSEVRVCELEADNSEGPCEEYRVAEEGRVEKEQQIAARSSGTNFFTLYKLIGMFLCHIIPTTSEYYVINLETADI